MLPHQRIVFCVAVIAGHDLQHFPVLPDLWPACVNRAIGAHRIREVIINVAPSDIEKPPLQKCGHVRIERILKRVHVVVSVPPNTLIPPSGGYPYFGWSSTRVIISSE